MWKRKTVSVLVDSKGHLGVAVHVLGVQAVFTELPRIVAFRCLRLCVISALAS